MISRSFFRYLLPLSLGLAGCLSGCLTGEKNANRGTVVDNELRVGILYLADGKPAINARVRVYPVGHIPDSGAAVFSARTDAKGQYAVDSLPKGEYNILGDLEGEYSYQDSVYIAQSTDTLPGDTLGAPGSVAGIVALQPHHDTRTATVQALGTNSFSNVDASGRFRLANLGAGRYTVRALTTEQGYTPYYFSLVVRSGRQDTLAETVSIPFTGLPVVTGLRATYDTATGTTRLTWNPVSHPSLADYLIYRTDADDLEPSLVPIGKVKGTVFLDAVLPPLDREASAPLDTAPHGFQYRVKARNLSDQVGPHYGSVDVKAYSPDILRTQVVLAQTPYSARVRDTIRIPVDYRNTVRKHTRITWSQRGKGALRVREIAAKSGVDTLLWVPQEIGSQLVRVEIDDETGKTWYDDRTIFTFADPPQTQVQRDTVLWLGDTLRLRDLGGPGDWNIVSWKWLLPGEPDFVSVTGGDTTVTVTRPGLQKFSLRVTDEFGQDTERSFMVTIAALGSIWKPTSIELPYIEGRDVKRTFLSHSGKVLMLLSSWDETGVKPVQVWSSPDLQSWTRVSASADFAPRVVRSATVFAGKLWVLGGEKSSGGASSYNDVWSSPDGATWTLVSATSPVDTGNRGDYAFVLRSRLTVVALDGDLWQSSDGMGWSNVTKGVLIPSEVSAGAESPGGVVLAGKDGGRGANFSIFGSYPQWGTYNWARGRFILFASLGEQVYWSGGSDIQTVYSYGINILRPLPKDWASSLAGLYPHGFLGHDGALWTLQGGRFRNEPRKVDVYISRGIQP